MIALTHKKKAWEFHKQIPSFWTFLLSKITRCSKFFNKTILVFLDMVKFHFNEKHGLENSVSDLLVYYNNRNIVQPGLLLIESWEVLMINNLSQRSSFRQKSLKRLKNSWELWRGQLVRISNYTQQLRNTKYIAYQPPSRLQKNFFLRKWK